MSEQYEKQTYDRISALEADVSSLKQDVAAIGPQLSSIARKLDTLESKENQPTNWLGVIGIFAMFASSIVWFNQRISDHAAEQTHYQPAVNQVAIDKLDTVLQREMRLLDDILQREIALNREIIERDLAQLNERVNDIDNEGSRAWNDRGSPDG